MKSILRSIYHFLPKVKKENLDITIKIPPETVGEPFVIIRGMLSPDDMRSLYSNRLWHVRHEITGGEYTTFISAKHEEGLFTPEELSLPL